MSTVDRIVVFLSALALAAACAAGLGGCALARPRPLEVMVSKPCTTTLPTKAKLVTLAEVERVAYLDGEGEAKLAMRIVADAESVSRLFGYLEALEEIARRSLGCVAR